jgi:hypothetical protein
VGRVRDGAVATEARGSLDDREHDLAGVERVEARAVIP